MVNVFVRNLGVLVLFLVLSATVSPTSIAQVSTVTSAPECNVAARDSVLDLLFHDQFEDSARTKRKNRHVTESFLVMHIDSQDREKILLESYAEGYGVDKQHNSWSVAKTFGGTLIALADQEGYLHETDRVKKYIPQFQTDATLLDVLRMGSGLDFSEVYAGLPVASDVVRMLYLDGRQGGILPYLLTLPVRNEKPGEHFYYSSGDTNLLMSVLQRALPKDQYATYPWTRLFDQIGMGKVTFERDLDGAFQSASYLYATARGYARFGHLLANQGKYDGKDIISAKWWKLMNTVAPGSEKNPLTEPERAYTTQMSVNLPIESRKKTSEFLDLAQDAVMAFGVQGQMIIAIPSMKLVIVRNANDPGVNIDRNELFNRIGKFVESCGLPVNRARETDENKKILADVGPLPPSLDPERARWTEYRKLPKVIVNMTAKEFCSCRFVSKLTEKECHDRYKQLSPVVPHIEVDDEAKSVTCKFLGSKATSNWTSEVEGCR